MKTKRPPQAEPEWQEEELRASTVRFVTCAWPVSPLPHAHQSGPAAGAASGVPAPGRHRGGGTRRIRGFTMPASDASLWLDELEGG